MWAGPSSWYGSMMDALAGSPWSQPGTVAGFARSPPNEVLMRFAESLLAARTGSRVLDLGLRRRTQRRAARRDGMVRSRARPVVAHADRGRCAGTRGGRRRSGASRGSSHGPVARQEPQHRLHHRPRHLEFRDGVAEAARAARPGAALFVFTFSRHTLPPDTAAVPGEPFVFTEFSGQPQCFLTEDQLIAELAGSGLRPGFARAAHGVQPPAGWCDPRRGVGDLRGGVHVRRSTVQGVMFRHCASPVALTGAEGTP